MYYPSKLFKLAMFDLYVYNNQRVPYIKQRSTMTTEYNRLHNRGGSRPGAGRPKGTGITEGLPTRMMRVSIQTTNDQVKNIPELIDRINYWEEEYLAAKKRGESCRTYEKMLLLIEELRILGY